MFRASSAARAHGDTAPALCGPGYRRWILRIHHEALTVKNCCLAVPLVFSQDGADPGGGTGIVQRSGDQPKLHAQSVAALLDDDDRAQRGQRRIGFRFQ